jgi:Ca2+-transporting ATPase
MRSRREVTQQLGLSLDAGLTTEQIAASRRLFGSNRLTPLPREPLWLKFLAKFDEPIIKVLLAAALLSMFVALFKPPADTLRYGLAGGALAAIVGLVIVTYVIGRSHWLPSILFLSALTLWPIGPLTGGEVSVDGLAVMAAVILATGVAFASEYRSDREFELLNSGKESARVNVLRSNAVRTIGLEDVVVGDVVHLEHGDEIPADGRVVRANDFQVDQSLMTGESEPLAKHPSGEDEVAGSPEEPGVLYRGTHVVNGTGTMVVAEVGDATYLGQVAQRLSPDQDGDERIRQRLTVSKDPTPLQQKLEVLAGQISKVGYIAAGAIFLALLTRGWLSGELRWPTGDQELAPLLVSDAGYLLKYFMYMVIIIVVAVPEGLPMSVTVSLALAMRRMTRANSLVRQLIACETIGSTTVICTDKTGTLTQNKMQVVRVSYAGQDHERGADWLTLPSPGAWSNNLDPLTWMTMNAAINATAHLEDRGGKLVPVGNPTEAALLQWLQEESVDYQKLRSQVVSVYQVPFTSEHKRMVTVCRCGDRLVSLVKGAPEAILEQSVQFQAADGSVSPWTVEGRERIQNRLEDAARSAMRTLAFAYHVLPNDFPADAVTLQARRCELDMELTYVGFVAIRDALRSDVKDALAQCRSAGIEVKMITGDSVETARAIGVEAGLLVDSRDEVMTSQEFNALADDVVVERMPRLRILARARPLDKLRLVRLLQEKGEVVAVTGDGTNDAPALRRADVGLSMGIAGTEVAKEASNIVLLDDAFSTIVKAVSWGRALYENIQRFVQFQLTINISALTIAFLGPLLFNVEPPFTVLQLLWINVIMDTLAAIALCSEPPRPGLLRMPPKRRAENIVTGAMTRTILSTAGFLVVAMLALLAGMKYAGWFGGSSPPAPDLPHFTLRQVSIFFTAYIMFQVWNEVNCRSLVPEISGWTGIWNNRIFLGVVAAIVVLHVLIVTFGGNVFMVEPLSVADWLAITGATASVTVFAEIVRRLRRSP